MGKGANKDLLANSGKANAISDTATSNANSLYSTLDPMLTKEATNPTGYDPSDLAAANTAVQQSVGGSVAGATGQGNLEAARTRNAGGFQGAIASSARNGMRQNSELALETQLKNADMKQAQKMNAQSALEGLYGQNTNTSLGGLNTSNSALGGVKPGFLPTLLNTTIGGAAQVGSAYENSH